MASFMIQVSKIVSVAIIGICFCLIHVTLPILSHSAFGQEVPQPNSAQNPEAKPKTHSVDLTWKASPSVVVGYNVYRAEKPEGPFTKLNSSPIRQTNYKDVGVQAGHAYFYKVAAVDAKGRESKSVSPIEAVVPSP
jgi:fibronectin type 3 domain-containing protein